jgi:hypothetical protein
MGVLIRPDCTTLIPLACALAPMACMSSHACHSVHAILCVPRYLYMRLQVDPREWSSASCADLELGDRQHGKYVDATGGWHLLLLLPPPHSKAADADDEATADTQSDINAEAVARAVELGNAMAMISPNCFVMDPCKSVLVASRGNPCITSMLQAIVSSPELLRALDDNKQCVCRRDIIICAACLACVACVACIACVASITCKCVARALHPTPLTFSNSCSRHCPPLSPESPVDRALASGVPKLC